jgi:hypothetical protein
MLQGGVLMQRATTLFKKLSILLCISFVILLITGTGRAELVRFIVTGDSRGSSLTNPVNTTILSEIAQATIAESANFILFTGDLVYGSINQATLKSQLTTWRTTMQGVYNAHIGVYPCRGNHDTGSKAAWDNVFTGNYALPGNGPNGEETITFSFTYKNVFIVGLDQFGSHTRRINQPWLDTQLSSNKQPHVFVFGHEPAFKVYHSDCLDDYPTERNTFWNSIAAHCGRFYFSAHDHMYNHARIADDDGNPQNDLHQYVVATAGAPFYNWAGSYDGNNGSWTPQLVYNEEQQYGYLLVEVDGLNVTLTWKHRIAPGVYAAGGDQFTYTFNDSDGDGVCDEVDNCPAVCNPQQLDRDGDGLGDLCDPSPGCGGCNTPTCEQPCVTSRTNVS